jgi:histone H3/H4
MKTRTLRNYIPKLLRNISICDITQEAKIHLDCILYHITNTIMNTSVNLLNMAVPNRLIITNKTLVNTVRIMFTGGLLTNILKEGDDILRLNRTEIKKRLVFPICFFKSIFKTKNIKVSKNCYVYMAAIIEYIAVEILDTSSAQTFIEKHIRITPRDIYMALICDKELSHIVTVCNIKHIDCGIKPKPIEGTKPIIQDIRLYQNTYNLLLSKHPFSRIVRQLVNNHDMTECKISKDTFILLQHYIENYIVQLLINTNKLCLHSNRTKVTSDDVLFMYKLII